MGICSSSSRTDIIVGGQTTSLYRRCMCYVLRGHWTVFVAYSIRTYGTAQMQRCTCSHIFLKQMSQQSNERVYRVLTTRYSRSDKYLILVVLVSRTSIASNKHSTATQYSQVNGLCLLFTRIQFKLSYLWYNSAT